MVIDTLSTSYFITNPGGNVSITTLVAPNNQLARPTGSGTAANDGVISLGEQANYTCNGLRLLPFGVGSAGQTFNLYVFGWAPTLGNQGAINAFPLWCYCLLASFTCTIANPTTNATAAAGSDVATLGTNYFCDTIATVTGNANVSFESLSPTTGVQAHIMIDIKGFRLAEVRFGSPSTGTPATSANCLAAKV